MKNITDEFKEIIKDTTTNLVRCWKITLKNNEVFAFTTASENFTYDGVEYNQLSANDISDLNTNLDINNDTVKISNLICSDLISANDILSGKYDGASIELFIVDLENLDKGKLSLMNGRISDIEFKDNTFIANVKGLKDEIDKVIGDVYTPLCRATFCDKKCKLNSVNFTYEGAVDSIVDNIMFMTSNDTILSKAEGYFENGIIEFTSGENIGQRTEIKQFNNGKFMLSSELPYKLNIGDTFKAITGCDKQFKTCCEKFHNAINFRGEPHLPGIELLLKVL